MLIYNYQKEFLGIDENDLKSLGFSDFAHLRRESSDFADFFVKTPGFVHNFKHVHWIDFVTCADGSEDSKVIIHANGKNYRCTLDIRTAYLIDNPDQKAYLIHLMNLRALTHSENEQISGDVFERPTLKSSTESKNITRSTSFVNTTNEFENTKSTQDLNLDYESEITQDPYELNIEDDFEETHSNEEPLNFEENFSSSDLIQEETVEPNLKTLEVKPAQKQLLKDTKVAVQELEVGADYVYDPHVASEELGLPVDLIEEFIQDFINQANEFKDDLYLSLKDNNISNLKILSHKLKGVAANLRVEDALEVLTIINTVEDTEVVEMNLDTFYQIVSKLSNDESSGEKKEEKTEDEEEIVLSFKDEPEEKEETPKPIETPELIETPDFKDAFVNMDKQSEEIVENPQKQNNIEEKIISDNDIKESEPKEEKIELDYDFNNLETPQKIETDKVDLEVTSELESNIKEHSSNQDLLYDKMIVANEIGIDIDSFNELFEDYLLEATQTSNEITTAIENNDVELWQRSAIKLKGMSDNMRVHDVVAELTSIIHTSDSNRAKKAINIVNNKLEQISKVEV